MAQPVTDALRAHLDKIRDLAEERGMNLWDALNAAGLLFTEDRRRVAEGAAIRRAATHLDSLGLAQITGTLHQPHGVTAGDMRRGLTTQLILYAETMENARG